MKLNQLLFWVRGEVERYGCTEAGEQGDRIGKFFASFAIAHFRMFYSEKSQKQPILLGNFFSTTLGTYALILTWKSGLGIILGDFLRKTIWSPCWLNLCLRHSCEKVFCIL
jgi:hypothetical protein